MTKLSIQTVKFDGQSLYVLNQNGAAYVSVRKLCDNLGISFGSQRDRIRRHPVLKTCVLVTSTQLPDDTQSREQMFIPLNKLNGWLFGINASRCSEDVQDRLIQYQSECFDVLADHFGATGKSKDQPVAELDAMSSNALALAGVACGQVFGQVIEQIARSTPNKTQRWLLTYEHTPNGGKAPKVKQLPDNARVGTPAELARLIKHREWTMTLPEHAAIASACTYAISQCVAINGIQKIIHQDAA